MRKCQWFGVMFCFLVFCLSATSFPAEAQEKVIRLRYASFFPPVHKLSGVLEQWCKEVEKRTNGRVKITYLPGGTLVPPPQAYEAAVRGVADITIASPSWVVGRFPLSEVLELPLGYTNSVQATRLANAFYKKFRPKEYDDVKVLYMYFPAPGCFMTLKPISSIEGLKGLKVRAGGNQAKIVLAMGALPVSMPLGDVYDGLQRGVIEGSTTYPQDLRGFRLGDLIRGLQINLGLAWAGSTVNVMNKAKWNALPPDVQRIIDQVNEEWIDKSGETSDEFNKEAIESAVSMGMKVFNISPEEVKITRGKVEPLLGEYVKSMKEKGLPGEEALKFCQDYIKAHP
jgi:TRAP-type transport system periplasmic protein